MFGYLSFTRIVLNLEFRCIFIDRSACFGYALYVVVVVFLVVYIYGNAIRKCGDSRENAVS